MEQSAKKTYLFFFILSICLACQQKKSIFKNPLDNKTKVVSLAPNITEIIYAIGAQDYLVGVTRYCNYPPEAMLKPKIGGMLDINIEALIGLKPDLVIQTQIGSSENLKKSLKHASIELMVLDFNNINDLLMGIQIIGKKLNLAENANKLMTKIKSEIEANTVNTKKEKPNKILCILGHQPLVVAGNGVFLNELIELAGGINAAGNSKIPYPVWSIEEVLKSKPDIIIETNMDQIQNPFSLWTDFKEIPAVKNNRMVVLDRDLLTRPGPRIGETLKALKNIIF